MKSTVYAHLENDYRFYRLPLFRATAVKYGLLSFTVIGLVISVSDEWQEMGDKIIDKL